MTVQAEKSKMNKKQNTYEAKKFKISQEVDNTCWSQQNLLTSRIRAI